MVTRTLVHFPQAHKGAHEDRVGGPGTVPQRGRRPAGRHQDLAVRQDGVLVSQGIRGTNSENWLGVVCAVVIGKELREGRSSKKPRYFSSRAKKEIRMTGRTSLKFSTCVDL